MRKLKDWIDYQRHCFEIWFREFRLRLLGVDRRFTCQREEEWETKCKEQCEHCKVYYEPIDKNHNDC